MSSLNSLITSRESPNPFGFALPSVIPTYTEIKGELDQRNVYGLTDFFNYKQVSQIVEAFYNARPDWVEGFEGEQYSLGEAFYHYSEAGDDLTTYYNRAVASREIVDRHIPGMNEYIMKYLRKFLQTDSVYLREHWAGPGIVNFLANKWVAKNGGAVHYDTEGLNPNDLLDPNFETFSFVSMLQKPISGGDLTIWDKPYNHNNLSDRNNDPQTYLFPNPVGSKINYKLGELWMFNGLRAHIIEPFQGNKDRICLTFHIARKENSWELWF